jgi:hypothetical protein
MKLNPHHTRPILLAAILIGFCAEQLFFGKALGLSLPLFVLLFCGVLIYLARRSGTPATRRNLWLFGPLLFFATMVAVRDNGFVSALNVLAVATLLAYLVLYFTAGRVGEFGLLTAAILPGYAAGKSLLAAGPIVTEAVDVPQTIRTSRGNVLAIVRGGLLAAPLLLVFTVLLASADLVFANKIMTLLDPRNIIHLFRLNLHATFIASVSWAAAGGLAIALNGRDDAAALDQQVTRLRRFRILGATESTTLLTLIDLLFLAFVIIQFRYLFGGQANINLDGYTYAEYARRGFFELLLVAILALGVILGLEAVTNRQSKRQFKVFNLLSTLMVVLVVIMLVSAFRRMHLYEATYGYTELRLYVYVFMIWLSLFLVWFLVGLWRRPDSLALGAVIIGLGFVASLNLINPDAFIVRQNIARYLTGGDLDIHYLESLSADAVPALVAAMTAPCPASTDDNASGACGTKLAGVLREGLQDRLQTMRHDPQWRRWQSVRLSRWLAYQQLSRLFPS